MFVADTHVHIYAAYDGAALWDTAFERLVRRADGGLAALFLAERSDCRAFSELAGGRAVAPPYRAEPSPEPGAVVVRHEAWAGGLHVFAGRQVVTRERLEILALATEAAIPDGLGLEDVVERVADAGGVPVLPWSPGKWLGGRGRVVAEAIRGHRPGELLLGDTAMRPAGWPEPGLMRQARAKGLRVVAGSDPLPFAGEERKVGQYGVIADVPPDLTAPVTWVRHLLRDDSAPFWTTGRRDTPWTMAGRWWKHRRVSRGTGGQP